MEKMKVQLDFSFGPIHIDMQEKEMASEGEEFSSLAWFWDKNNGEENIRGLVLSQIGSGPYWPLKL